ncbi:rhamnogalacturonan acetylesterase [Terrimonas rubra]|uniref:Rhamnogalacturonan acetylesterase n=1 Tax=Terrimonas rubra TaxID=1035890 RepID=A0ABW6A706_9BACT
MKHKILIPVLILVAVTSMAFVFNNKKPVLYIIGDSTVKSGKETDKDIIWGWGSLMAPYFDTGKIAIENHAIGGRSSRTFITDGRWDKILATLKKGDYVIMQFGHNDASPLDDTARARGTLKGIGNDSIATYNPIRKQNETVYSYGFYMRRYVRETKAKGAIPIICSPVPRNNWKDNKVVPNDYINWAQQVAKEEGAYYIPLFELISAAYEKMGKTEVDKFFPQDKTHPDKAGSALNAAQVVEGIKNIKKDKLKKYLRK